MNISKKNRNLLSVAFIVLCISSSCIPIPILHSRTSIVFRNCTDDTLFIGASHYNCIDSIEYFVNPEYAVPANSELDTTEIFPWGVDFDMSDSFVCPDSSCAITMNAYEYRDNETWYLFLVKRADAKRYSWDEIRKKKLFHRWTVTIKTRDEYDKYIRY